MLQSVSNISKSGQLPLKNIIILITISEFVLL
jgi:hypothetical protein